jgi:hypothetical protein
MRTVMCISYCFLASELSIEKIIKYSRQAANSQSMGFAINISQGVENRDILLRLNGY